MSEIGVDPSVIVYVVDDDEAVRDSLRAVFESADIQVRSFGDAESFLAVSREKGPACLVLDVRLPGLSGLDLQHIVEEAADGCLPVIMISAHAHVESIVRAIKDGAIDFIEKPIDHERLLRAVALAGRDSARRLAELSRILEVRDRFRSLTARERDVMRLMVADLPSKIIAHQLGISLRTVETHRARVMKKMRAHSLMALGNMTQLCQFDAE